MEQWSTRAKELAVFVCGALPCVQKSFRCADHHFAHRLAGARAAAVGARTSGGVVMELVGWYLGEPNLEMVGDWRE